jgi:predicted DNA-binding protein
MVSRRCIMKYTGYVVTSVKMPKELKERIDRLAAGRGLTRNGWIVKVLAREARWTGNVEK